MLEFGYTAYQTKRPLSITPVKRIEMRNHLTNKIDSMKVFQIFRIGRWKKETLSSFFFLLVHVQRENWFPFVQINRVRYSNGRWKNCSEIDVPIQNSKYEMYFTHKYSFEDCNSKSRFSQALEVDWRLMKRLFFCICFFQTRHALAEINNVTANNMNINENILTSIIDTAIPLTGNENYSSFKTFCVCLKLKLKLN